MNKARFKLLALFPLLVLDCIGCLIIGGSPRNTLSGEAYWHQDHKFYGWCYGFINGLFNNPKHCETAALHEAEHGSWLAYWQYEWRKA